MEGIVATVGGSDGTSPHPEKPLHTGHFHRLIVATGKGPIQFAGRNNTRDEREDEMMTVHWEVNKFFSQIPAYKQKEIQPCPKCFRDLVLMAELWISLTLETPTRNTQVTHT